jgi:hypothetical protein
MLDSEADFTPTMPLPVHRIPIVRLQIIDARASCRR